MHSETEDRKKTGGGDAYYCACGWAKMSTVGLSMIEPCMNDTYSSCKL